jgi:hypothetical protein
MAIGVPVSAASINGQAGVLAARWKQLAADLLEFATVTGALALADLEALGFTSGDAASIANIATQMGTVAGVYYGTTAQAVPVNYDSSFLQVRGTT